MSTNITAWAFVVTEQKFYEQSLQTAAAAMIVRSFPAPDAPLSLAPGGPRCVCGCLRPEYATGCPVCERWAAANGEGK